MKSRFFLKKYWMVILAVLYILSPVDFISDFLPMIGLGDDLLVSLLAGIIKYLQSKRESKKDNVIEGEVVE